jgi:hypothetical protein
VKELLEWEWLPLFVVITTYALCWAIYIIYILWKAGD